MITLTIPSGSNALRVLAGDGNFYAITGGTVTVPLRYAGALIAAGYIAGVVS